MSTHRPILSTNEIYHLYNQSIGKELIFNSQEYLNKILNIIDYYRYPQTIRLSKLLSLPQSIQNDYLQKIKKNNPLIEIYSFSFMPNHYHLLLKQLQDRGISQFISNVQNSFAKYLNLKKGRNGGLFLNSFKAKHIVTNEQFIHVARYIHLNPITSFLIEFEDLKTYPWTSYSWYLNKKINRFVVRNLLFNHFKTIENLVKFTENQVDYQRKLKIIKDLLIERG